MEAACGEALQNRTGADCLIFEGQEEIGLRTGSSQRSCDRRHSGDSSSPTGLRGVWPRLRSGIVREVFLRALTNYDYCFYYYYYYYYY